MRKGRCSVSMQMQGLLARVTIMLLCTAGWHCEAFSPVAHTLLRHVARGHGSTERAPGVAALGAIPGGFIIRRKGRKRTCASVGFDFSSLSTERGKARSSAAGIWESASPRLSAAGVGEASEAAKSTVAEYVHNLLGLVPEAIREKVNLSEFMSTVLGVVGRMVSALGATSKLKLVFGGGIHFLVHLGHEYALWSSSHHVGRAVRLLAAALLLKYSQLYWAIRSPLPSQTKVCAALRERLTRNAAPGSDKDAMMHEAVRSDIVYGSMVQAAYDLFVMDSSNKYYGQSIVDIGHFHDGGRVLPEELRQLERFLRATVKDLPEGMEVLDFLYTAAAKYRVTTLLPQKEADERTFAGYIAYSPQSRDLSVVFRGTLTTTERQEGVKAGMAMWHLQSGDGEEWNMSILRWLLAGGLLSATTEHRGQQVPNIAVHRGMLGMYTRRKGDDLPPTGKVLAKVQAAFGFLWFSIDQVGSAALSFALGRGKNKKGAGEKDKEEEEEEEDEEEEEEGKEEKRDSLQEDVRQALDKYVREGKVDTVTVCGHGLGAGLATLCALDVAQRLRHMGTAGEGVKTRGKLFCSPRVGNMALTKELRELDVDLIHYCQRGDIIPSTPPNFLTRAYVPACESYRLDSLDVFFPNRSKATSLVFVAKRMLGSFASVLRIDADRPEDAERGFILHRNILQKFWSPWLLRIRRGDDFSFASTFHSLEVLLVNMARSVGLERDPGLLNKRANLLHDYNRQVPAKWWAPLLHNGVVSRKVSETEERLVTGLEAVRGEAIAVPSESEWGGKAAVRSLGKGGADAEAP